MPLLWVALLLPAVAMADPVIEGSVENSDTEECPEEVVGVLGESVTFRVKTPESFQHITWVKMRADNMGSENIRDRCTPSVAPFAKGYRRAPKDCKRLEISNLTRDDSGQYRAHIELASGDGSLMETFELQVYKRLTAADLAVRCCVLPNGTRRLECSAGPWEEGVAFTWASPLDAWDRVADIDPGHRNVTCGATNPVGVASRTVSVEEVCGEGHRDVQASRPSLGLTVAAMIVAKVVVSACVYVKWPRCPGSKRGPPELPAQLALREGVAAGRSPPPLP